MVVFKGGQKNLLDEPWYFWNTTWTRDTKSSSFAGFGEAETPKSV